MPSRRVRGDEGATAVETALVLPVVLLLLGGVLVFGLRMTYGGLAEHAATRGLRAATLQTAGTYPNEQAVRTQVTALFPVGLLGAPSCRTAGCRPVQLDRPGPARQGAAVTVTVRYDVGVLRAAASLLPLINADRLAVVSRTATGRLE